MTDFYSLLRQSILDRGIVDSGERDEIYAQARRAMIRRLWAFDPPLDEDEIEQRIGAFDVALSDVEADVMQAFSRRLPAYADQIEDRRGYGYPETRALPAPARLPAPERRRDERIEEARRVPAYQAQETDEDYYQRPVEPEEPPPKRKVRIKSPRQRKRPPPPPPPPQETYDEPEEPYEEERRRLPARARQDDDLPRRRTRRPQAQPQRHRSRAGWLARLSDREKITILAGAIGLCAVVLVGAGAFILLPRTDPGVTVDIGVRREVSDAATAVRIAQEDMDVAQSFLLFDGRDPTIFETSPDNPVRFNANDGVVRISSSTGSPGVKALIGPGLATRLAGHEVRVTIVARSSAEAGAAGMRFAYQSGVAISHWQTANLGRDYQAVGMTWRVPTLRTDRAGDLLVIQPGIPGDGTGADIKSIKIDLLS